MDAELIVLASVAGTAVVQTVGTEAWAVLQGRVASLFRRQGPEEVSPDTVLEWLDRTAAEVATAGPRRARQVRSRAALTWQTRFVELLEEGRGPGRYAVAAGLQEMVACARQTSGVVVPGPHTPAGIGVAPRNRRIVARSIDHLEIHQHHHSAQAPGWRPVRVGAVPPPASAFQSREGLRAELDQVRARHAVPTQVLSGGGGVGN
ncbi:hypothetical protein [Kitasatospora griseola]|uniref:hypothetical protein n=1 Tax=Kitasatospora griseola TaxID=2064 RepID=UPI000697D9A7|nr:hypothetical protein [Kitasatospora griseola]